MSTREDELARLITEQASDDTLFQRPERNTVPYGLQLDLRDQDGRVEVGRITARPRGCSIHGLTHARVWPSQPGKIKCGACERARDRARYQKRKVRR
jgi:hypothetical protein